MAIKGRLLESAVALGALHYARAGKADVRHNATPMGRRRDGTHYYRQKAGCDFSGPIQNGSFAAECKECHGNSFPIFSEDSGLKPHQRKALEDAAKLGAISGLIIAWLPAFRVYFIPIVELRQFLDLPWRQSLTEDMCKAWGVVLPVEPCGTRGKLAVRFLDGDVHPDKNAAIARVEADRLAHPMELPLEEPPKKSGFLERLLAEDPLDLRSIAKRARRKGIGGKKWSER